MLNKLQLLQYLTKLDITITHITQFKKYIELIQLYIKYEY